jgi:hypothetical protein
MAVKVTLINTGKEYIKLLESLASQTIDGVNLYTFFGLNAKKMMDIICFRFSNKEKRTVKSIYLKQLQRMPIFDVLEDLCDMDRCTEYLKNRQKPKTLELDEKGKICVFNRLLTTYVACDGFPEKILKNSYSGNGISYTPFINYIEFDLMKFFKPFSIKLPFKYFESTLRLLE